MIRKSKKLNQLLYDNRYGLRAFHNELKKEKDKGKGYNPNIFDLNSAQEFFNKINEPKGGKKAKNADAKSPDFIPNLRECFVISKMTNLNDLEDSKEYWKL